MKNKLWILLFAVTSFNCSTDDSVEYKSSLTELDREQFNQYWYTGMAELASYELIQLRYGEKRTGQAVIIFVTEDFSKEKQVKLDFPEKNPEDKISVLKLNFTKNFQTGIYPYSMMMSVFTPIDRYHYPHSLKATMSSQEWCGQVWHQLNMDKDHYLSTSQSYFESEGDQQNTIGLQRMEDELWSIIRIDYTSLPLGKIKLIPGLFFTRLNHQPLNTTDAEAVLIENNNGSLTYKITYPEIKRILSITFENKTPYKILSWEETEEKDGQRTTLSQGNLKKTLYTDYWTKNSSKFEYLRDSLDLN